MKKALDVNEVLLVSSPGPYWTLGAASLSMFRQLWQEAQIPQPAVLKETNVFRFGNGSQEVSNDVVEMPLVVAGHRGVVRAAIIRKRARPLSQ